MDMIVKLAYYMGISINNPFMSKSRHVFHFQFQKFFGPEFVVHEQSSQMMSITMRNVLGLVMSAKSLHNSMIGSFIKDNISCWILPKSETFCMLLKRMQ